MRRSVTLTDNTRRFLSGVSDGLLTGMSGLVTPRKRTLRCAAFKLVQICEHRIEIAFRAGIERLQLQPDGVTGTRLDQQ